MIWYALLIPILISVLGWFLFKSKIVWWEVLIPVGASALFILISYFTMKSTTLEDVEYNGYIITEARYYEPYITWVDKTCSRSVPCGTDSKGNTKYCTQYYDCSYCEENGPRWTMLDSGGNEIGITEGKYLALVKKWSATKAFVELNRDIDYHGGCGQDGDMYRIVWDQHIFTSETTTYEKSFTNILKSNHSAFNYPNIEKDKARTSGLYEYPQFGEYNYQPCVLGIKDFNSKVKNRITKSLEYLNGAYGSKYKVKVFTLFYKNRDIDTAFQQEAYWDGGNQNEIVVCIGLNNLGNIEWIKPFSWCDDKQVLVNIREDLMEATVKDEKAFYKAYMDAIKTHWHYKSFEDFNYLSFEPTTGQLLFVYIMTFIISVGAIAWGVMNEENPED
jgi:hypothetical protein